jgi:hypothetical protein
MCEAAMSGGTKEGDKRSWCLLGLCSQCPCWPWMLVLRSLVFKILCWNNQANSRGLSNVSMLEKLTREANKNYCTCLLPFIEKGALGPPCLSNENLVFFRKSPLEKNEKTPELWCPQLKLRHRKKGASSQHLSTIARGIKENPQHY